MKQSIWKRVVPAAMILLLLLAAGCGSSPAKDAAEEIAQEPVVMEAEPQADAASVDHSSLYAVDGTTEISDNDSFASDTANVNTVLVQNAGVLAMTSADLNKTGDSSGDFSGGQNAAVAVLTKGQMTLMESNITTNAVGACGLFAAGNGTTLTLSGTSVYTSGDSSPALAVRDGASAVLTGGSLSAEGMDTPALLLSGGKLTLSAVTLSAKNGELLRILAGENELTLDNTLLPTSSFGEEATLVLRLASGSSYGGALGGSLPARASVYLDAASKLILTEETYVSVLVNADLTHANIESTGFNLYYDSNAPENAYLGGQSFMLPGGGFLAPII